MQISQEQVMELTREIWGNMLGVDVNLADPSHEATPHDRVIVGCVQIAGAWEGAVRLDCSAGLARRAAAGFLGLPPAGVSDDEMCDAVGELANMSAGSVKSLLVPNCHLSLPSVVDGKDFELTVRNASIICRTAFQSDGDMLYVSIVEAQRAHTF